ncbi:MAG: hypothetical protein Q4G50_11370 [Corynebacterium sp.]|uniref:hypothetical protein n=1 Tax=Corynebacterium sp. TaxID=1720 RepID=UPI0026E07E51|nr:hypothetical protein [Corynebacterium sp.]MDO5670588.1 hypothetical protein [Corynebacterium sp.]
MGRHRNESAGFSVAGWVIAAFIAVLALIAVAVWWFGFRGEEQPQAQECIQGELTLPVAGDTENLISAYNDTDPVVRDYCVNADAVEDIAQAAVVIGEDPELGERSIASSSPVPGGTAHVLNPAGEVTEEQTRAGADFLKFHETGAPTPAETTTAAAPAASEPGSTLILFDTSAQSEPVHEDTTEAIADLAVELSEAGQQVALWNYSSPLNPGVTRGWRTNVSFTDGSEAAAVVRGFGTGGVPQTRSAVVAAVANAADQARATGEPVRVLVVTTGTAQDMDDAAFAEAFDQAQGDADVIVEVAHLGDGEIDAALAEVSTSVEL